MEDPRKHTKFDALVRVFQQARKQWRALPNDFPTVWRDNERLYCENILHVYTTLPSDLPVAVKDAAFAEAGKK